MAATLNFDPSSAVLVSGPTQAPVPAPASSFDPSSAKLITPAGSGNSYLDAVNAFITGIGNHVAVPGKPNWNANALATTIDSHLPSWLGGDSKQDLQAQDAANAQNHPTTTSAGNFAGTGASAIAGSELAAPLADLLPGTGLAANVGRSVITNAAGGAAATPSNPLAGAAVGGGFGVLGGAASTGASKLMSALRAVKNPTLAGEMTNAGLTPTVAAVGSPMLGKIGQALSHVKDAVTNFSQNDVVRAALKPFGITNTTDLTDSTIGRAEHATWNASNNLVKNTTVTPTPQLAQNVGQILFKYKGAVGTPDLNPAVAQYANDILTKANSGSWNGTDALGLYRSIRNAGYSASDPFTKQALGGLADELQTTLGAANPDVLPSLAQSNALHQKLLVLKDVAEKANAKPGGVPTLQDFAMSNKKFTPYGSVEGPYQGLVDASQNAYVPPAGSTGRYGTPLAALASKAAPFVGGWAGEHLASGLLGESPVASALGMALGAGGEKLGENAVSKVLSNALLKPAGTAVSANNRSKVAAALAAALKGNAANAVAGQNDQN